MKVGDAPADSVIAFELTINKIVLTTQRGNAQPVLSSPTEVELSHLAGTVETLTLTSIPSDTYTQATISFSNPEVTVIPSPGAAPVEKQFNISGSVNVPLNNGQGLTLSSTASVLSFEVILAQSLTFDASGNVTAVNPVFTAFASSLAPQNLQEEENGAIEEATGVISAPPATNSFTMTLEMTGQSATFNVNSSTQFSNGLGAFGDLKQGMLVEVDAVTQPDNSLLATEVELEETQGVEAEGIVISLNNPLTQFTILDDDGAGSGISAANVGATVTVNVNPTGTQFRANLDHVDMSNLNFVFSSASNLAKGQMVEAESAAGMQANNTVNADRVILVKQALTGVVANYTPNNSGGATFTLNLPADSAFFKLTGVGAINAYQQPKTELKGLPSVGNGATVRVRGLLFFDGANYQFVAVRITAP